MSNSTGVLSFTKDLHSLVILLEHDFLLLSSWVFREIGFTLVRFNWTISADIFENTVQGDLSSEFRVN